MSLVGVERLTENLIYNPDISFLFLHLALLYIREEYKVGDESKIDEKAQTYRDPLEARQLIQWHRPQYWAKEALGIEMVIAPQLQEPLIESSAGVVMVFLAWHGLD
jgi:hypothetical protein